MIMIHPGLLLSYTIQLLTTPYNLQWLAGFAQTHKHNAGPGIPVGLELMGIPWKDDELLDIAEVFEEAIQGRRPPVLTSGLS